MKKPILLLLLTTSLSIFSQKQYNFDYTNNQLSWIKVYNSKLTFNKIYNIISENENFKNIDTLNGSIKGTLKNLIADYKGAGKSGMFTSFYIQNSSIEANFKIDFKEDRYRIKINSILLKTLNDLNAGGFTVANANSKEPLSNYAIKREKLKKGFLKNDAKIFDFTFNKIFEFDKYTTKKGDW